jgi:deoxyribodipyrimidine photo-lyase
MSQEITAFWFRRDLRLEDNIGLSEALRSGRPVVGVFLFDREILDELPRKDARVEFIHQQLSQMQAHLQEMGSSLIVRYGKPLELWPELIREFSLKAIYTNHDYEPYARHRDEQVKEICEAEGIDFQTFRDQVIFEKREILTQSDSPYTVFTPYSKKWKASLTQERLRSVEVASLSDQWHQLEPQKIPSLAEMGFEPAEIAFPPSTADRDVLAHYDQKRDFPAQPGTSRMGVHLRFGTISIRKLARTAIELNETYLNELIWREFYAQILWNFPHVVQGPFRSKYEAIPWRDAPEELEKWKQGQTGFPLVDAGMRELNATGFMHNRVRMLVASFLSKHLLINWQEGERYFAEKLLDFELASNNGGWQWAAGCGTDAAPYFRIFNPESQLKKFDPKCRYVQKWVPEFGTPLYPRPMVNHKAARERCLETYKAALG